MTKNHSQRKGINIQGTRKRRKLLNAAGEAFAKMGYERTTIRDIAEIAKVQPSALIYHFDNKRNLFYETLRHHVLDNPNLKTIFEPLKDLKEDPQSVSDVLFAVTKNIISALFDTKQKIPHLRGLLITMLIDGDKMAHRLIQGYGIISLEAINDMLQKVRPDLTENDLFWARHLYWSMIFYSVVCEQILIARLKEKKYSKEFLDNYAYRTTKSFCDRFNLPKPNGEETWFYKSED